MRLSFLYLASLALALGSTFAAGQDPRAIERRQKLQAETDRHVTLLNDSQLDPIRTKIALQNPSQATLAMMALSGFPTQAEQRAIEKWQQIRRATRLRFEAVHQQYTPWVVPFYEMEAAAEFTLVADLYTGKLTYGQFNRQRYDLRSKMNAAIQSRQEELQAEAVRRRDMQQAQQQAALRQQEVLAARQRQAELDRQQRLAAEQQKQQNFEREMALAKFQAYLQAVQLVNQQLRPTRVAPFSCMRMGNLVECY